MEPAETQKPTVLIIDDAEQIRHLLIDVLGDSYECSDAGSAEDALAALADHSFDLVISDIDMGGMSGLELVPHVSPRHRPSPTSSSRLAHCCPAEILLYKAHGIDSTQVQSFGDVLDKRKGQHRAASQ